MKEEYQKFANFIKEKDISYYSFQILYSTGIRLEELRALTKVDFNFEKMISRINKSTQQKEGNGGVFLQ